MGLKNLQNAATFCPAKVGLELSALLLWGSVSGEDCRGLGVGKLVVFAPDKSSARLLSKNGGRTKAV